MPEWLKIGLPALIALIGTAVTAALAYRQWQRQQKTARSDEFVKDRKAAYAEMWKLIEDLEVDLRTTPESALALEARMTGLHTVLLRNGLYIDAQHRVLVEDYVSALRSFNRLIRGSKDPGLIGNWETTAESLPPGAAERMKEIADAHERVQALRRTLIDDFRRVLRLE